MANFSKIELNQYAQVYTGMGSKSKRGKALKRDSCIFARASFLAVSRQLPMAAQILQRRVSHPLSSWLGAIISLLFIPFTEDCHSMTRTQLQDLISMHAVEQIELEIIGGGTSGLINLRPDKAFVEKAPRPDNTPWEQKHSLRDLQREYAAYRRLPNHPRFLHLHPDSTPEKLVLPYLPKGSLHQFLRSRTVSISSAQRLQFSADAAEAVHLLHCGGIVHGDINSFNFLLSSDTIPRLCIIDFAGSTFDGIAGSAFEGVRYCFPRPWDVPSTVKTDLFALGCLLYEIETGREPHAEKGEEEVEELFRRGEWPDTEGLVLREVMLGCWRGKYGNAEMVWRDIEKVRVEVEDEKVRFSLSQRFEKS